MNTISNSAIVKDQYKSAANLSTRISLHDKYSVNKTGWNNWIASHYKITVNSRILELGCGTGEIWKSTPALLNNASELVLTDFSAGMLEAAKKNIGENSKITFQTADIQQIPFEENSFDTVIANMMLYHVPSLDKALSEVKRVLKPNGRFYCATYGEHGIVEYISGLLKGQGVEDTVNKNFTLQNGGELLRKYFSSVDRLDYEDALEVTDIDDLIDYVYSLSGMTNIGSVDRAIMKSIFESNMTHGVLRVPKEYGMFICG